jgi:hypothetical protein
MASQEAQIIVVETPAVNYVNLALLLVLIIIFVLKTVIKNYQLKKINENLVEVNA